MIGDPGARLQAPEPPAAAPRRPRPAPLGPLRGDVYDDAPFGMGPMQASSPRLADDVSLQWTVLPAAREPLRACAIAAIVALTALWVWSWSRSAVLTVAGATFLLLSLRAFFLPRTYHLDADGASEAGLLQARRRLEWNQVRRVSPQRFGVHLSTLHTTSRFVPDRGLFLRTDRNRGEVADFVRAHVEQT